MGIWSAEFFRLFVLVKHYIQPGETKSSGLHFYTLYMHCSVFCL